MAAPTNAAERLPDAATTIAVPTAINGSQRVRSPPTSEGPMRVAEIEPEREPGEREHPDDETPAETR